MCYFSKSISRPGRILLIVQIFSVAIRSSTASLTLSKAASFSGMVF